MANVPQDGASGGVTLRLLFAIFVAAFGSSFQYGYNVGVVNAPQKAIEAWITGVMEKSNITETAEEREHTVTIIYSLIVAVFCLGGLAGGLLVDVWMGILGLKNAIVLNNIFIFIAAWLMGTARDHENYYMLVAGRFFVGLNAGLGAGLAPMYLTEISPVALRGTVGSAFQLFLTVSILVAQIISMDFFLGTHQHWPILFYAIAVVGIFQVIFLPFCANSPRYLYSRGKEEDAKKALMWFRGTEDVSAELNQIKKEVEEEKSVGSVSLLNLFSKKQLRKPLIISCMLMIGQQLSGINAIIFYSTSTFEKANLGKFAQIGTLCIGTVNVCMTIISVMIVDKTGRRPLLIFGFAAMAIDTTLFCVFFLIAQHNAYMIASYLCIVFLMLYIIFFATGLGSIPWFIISELFTQNARPKAVSIAVGVHWIANFIVGLCFPSVQNYLGPYVFLIFVCIQVVFLFYVILFVPETKNKPIDEIQDYFKGGSSAEE